MTDAELDRFLQQRRAMLRERIVWLLSLTDEIIAEMAAINLAMEPEEQERPALRLVGKS